MHEWVLAVTMLTADKHEPRRAPESAVVVASATSDAPRTLSIAQRRELRRAIERLADKSRAQGASTAGERVAALRTPAGS
ncbi:MAG TPA: hypothetical protein VES20_23220 [Bryobacteraceae bacterium]|nr:hypothetical protein [Bryobacteraceae bacterium]